MKNAAQLLLLVCASALLACGQSRPAEPLAKEELSKPIAIKPGTNLTIRYIANEGVLIASAGKQILIDGLHREYKPEYLFPPPEMRDVLENARAPYAKIDLILVSHIHLDHFHPESIGLYVKNNSKAIFASSEQAVDEVAKKFGDYEKVRAQVKPVVHEWKMSNDSNFDGVKVRFLGLRHSGENFKHIQNFGHLIEIGGKKLLHIGDADMTAENFAAFNLAKEKIDIAFIPFWFLLNENGRSFVRQQFDPKHIIAVHIPPADANEVVEQLKKSVPDATAFTKILEERSY